MKKIVVYNLLDEDYEEYLISAIERKIATAIRKIRHIKNPILHSPNQDTVISFPKDPKVEMPQIPISIELQLIEEGTQIGLSDVKNLADIIRQKILSIRDFKGRIVWVDVKAFDNNAPVRIGIAQ